MCITNAYWVRVLDKGPIYHKELNFVPLGHYRFIILLTIDVLFFDRQLEPAI